MELNSRELDNYIMGVNDPNAPFNQVDWTETEFGLIVNECDWITSEMLEDEQMSQELYELISSFVNPLFDDDDTYYTSKARFALVEKNKKLIAAKVKTQFDIRSKQRIFQEALGYRTVLEPKK